MILSLPGLKQRPILQEGASGQTLVRFLPGSGGLQRPLPRVTRLDRSLATNEVTFTTHRAAQMVPRCPLRTELNLIQQRQLRRRDIKQGKTVTANCRVLSLYEQNRGKLHEWRRL